jgi:uncharacterized protein (DUF1919 family)
MFLGKILYRIQSIYKKVYLKRHLKNLRVYNFSIVSNNCWGGILYKDLQLQYQTPFVNMFIHGPCYINLLENIDSYLNKDLVRSSTSRYTTTPPNYPIGLLGEVEIHFIHYKDWDEALKNWNDRRKRFNPERLLLVLSERDGCTREHINRFDTLKFKNKVCFTRQDYKLQNTIQINSFSWRKGVPPADQIAGVTYAKLHVIQYLNNVFQ